MIRLDISEWYDCRPQLELYKNPGQAPSASMWDLGRNSWVCDYILTPKCRSSSVLLLRDVERRVSFQLVSVGVVLPLSSWKPELKLGWGYETRREQTAIIPSSNDKMGMLHWNSGVRWPWALQVKRVTVAFLAWKVSNGQRSASHVCAAWSE